MKSHDSNLFKLETLVTNSFERELLSACLENLKSTNKLRFHNFAYSIRELSRHFLKSLSPDEEIKTCSWFRNDTGEPNKYSRGERVKYAIQGGLNDQFLDKEILKLKKLDSLKSKVLKSIDLLNKYTHINEDTFHLTDEEIKEFSTQVLSAFKDFAETIQESRNYIIKRLEESITNQLLEKAMWEVSDEIDILATHHNIEDFYINEYKITKIECRKLIIESKGTVRVRLQWGSDGDLLRDDGHEMHTKFPFDSTFTVYLAKSLEKSKVKVNDYAVDTDSWYE